MVWNKPLNQCRVKNKLTMIWVNMSKTQIDLTGAKYTSTSDWFNMSGLWLEPYYLKSCMFCIVQVVLVKLLLHFVAYMAIVFSQCCFYKGKPGCYHYNRFRYINLVRKLFQYLIWVLSFKLKVILLVT